jgi:hypothetical protein
MLIFSTNTTITGLDNLVKAAGRRANTGIARALNRTGVPTETRYLREVRKVLGVKKHPLAQYGVIEATRKRVSRRRATPANLEYSLAGFGKGLNLIFYQPKEKPQGLSVMWLGSRRIEKKAFLHGGTFRKGRWGGFAKNLGIAMRNDGGGKYSRLGHSGLSAPRGPGIAEAMVEGSAVAVWDREAAGRLAPNIAKELRAILLGHAPGARK